MKKKAKLKSANKKKPKPVKIKKQPRIEKLEAVVSELAIRLTALEATLNSLADKQKSAPQPYPWPYPGPSWTKDWPIYHNYNYCEKKYS